MSMLMRYKKQGGFQQLLILFETSSPEARAELLKTIQNEDPGWAALLKTKMLTLEKVFSWNAAFLVGVLNGVEAETLAAVLATQGTLNIAKVLSVLSPLREKEVSTLLKERHFTVAESEAARVKLLVHIRDLDREGRIRIGDADPSLDLPDHRVA